MECLLLSQPIDHVALVFTSPSSMDSHTHIPAAHGQAVLIAFKASSAPGLCHSMHDGFEDAIDHQQQDVQALHRQCLGSLSPSLLH